MSSLQPLLRPTQSDVQQRTLTVPVRTVIEHPPAPVWREKKMVMDLKSQSESVVSGPKSRPLFCTEEQTTPPINKLEQ